jgi:hypothetical protein
MINSFEPCSDLLCYDIDINMDNFRNKYQSQFQYSMRDMDTDMEESSFFYNILKTMYYILLGSFIMILSVSISTFIVMLNDKVDNQFDEIKETGSGSESDGEDEDSNAGTETESDGSDSELTNETNYSLKYVNELKRLMNDCIEDENEDEVNKVKENNFNPTLTQEEKISLSDKVLMESTPKGNVIMYYNYDKEDEERSCFNYYCDNKSIPFNYLDTVSRKYVCSYNCPQIYRYLEKEIQEGIQKIKEMEELEKERLSKLESQNEGETTSRKRADSVFATLKNYKKTPSVTPGSNVKVLKSHLLVCKNRYKHLGTIEDYNESVRNKENQERVKEVKPISFSEFKQMNN